MRGLARPPDCVSTIPKGVDWVAAHRWWRIDDGGGGVKGNFLTLRFAWRSEKTTGPPRFARPQTLQGKRLRQPRAREKGRASTGHLRRKTSSTGHFAVGDRNELFLSELRTAELKNRTVLSLRKV